MYAPVWEKHHFLKGDSVKTNFKITILFKTSIFSRDNFNSYFKIIFLNNNSNIQFKLYFEKKTFENIFWIIIFLKIFLNLLVFFLKIPHYLLNGFLPFLNLLSCPLVRASWNMTIPYLFYCPKFVGPKNTPNKE